MAGGLGSMNDFLLSPFCQLLFNYEKPFNCHTLSVRNSHVMKCHIMKYDEIQCDEMSCRDSARTINVMWCNVIIALSKSEMCLVISQVKL